MRQSNVDNKQVIYAEVEEELVFLPEREAIELATTWKAINGSTTWGEFKKKLPKKAYQELVELMGDTEDVENSGEDSILPKDDEPFDAEEIPGYSDGDWPSWPAQLALDWIPKDIQKQFGQSVFSAVTGDALFFEPSDEQELLAAFQEHGFSCKKDQALIENANGFC